MCVRERVVKRQGNWYRYSVAHTQLTGILSLSHSDIRIYLFIIIIFFLASIISPRGSLKFPPVREQELVDTGFPHIQ